MLDHFWCDLLAAYACAIENAQHNLDKIPEHVTAAILETRATSERPVLEEATTRLAVQTTWKSIKKLPIFGQIDSVLRAVRILAVLICPAPERHRSVARHCLAPLTNGVLSAATKDRLTEALPEDWLSYVRKRLD